MSHPHVLHILLEAACSSLSQWRGSQSELETLGGGAYLAEDPEEAEEQPPFPPHSPVAQRCCEAKGPWAQHSETVSPKESFCFKLFPWTIWSQQCHSKHRWVSRDGLTHVMPKRREVREVCSVQMPQAKKRRTHSHVKSQSILMRSHRQRMSQIRHWGDYILSRCICGQLSHIGSMVCWSWELPLMRVSPVTQYIYVRVCVASL